MSFYSYTIKLFTIVITFIATYSYSESQTFKNINQYKKYNRNNRSKYNSY